MLALPKAQTQPVLLTCEWNLSPSEEGSQIKPLKANLLTACINQAREFPFADEAESQWVPISQPRNSGPMGLPGSHSVSLPPAGWPQKMGGGAECKLYPGGMHTHQQTRQIIKSLEVPWETLRSGHSGVIRQHDPTLCAPTGTDPAFSVPQLLLAQFFRINHLFSF